MRQFPIPADVAQEFRAAGYWQDKRLVDSVITTARDRGDSPAVIDETGEYSYDQLLDQASRLACWLKTRGVTRGSVVTVQLPNWREYSVVLLAIEICGACINPILPAYGKLEVEHVLRTCSSRVVFIPEMHRSRNDFMEQTSRILEESETLTDVVVLRSSADLPEHFWHFDEVLETEKAEPTGDWSGDDPVIIAFTSGTESQAKGCAHSHNTAMFALRTKAGILGLTHDDPIFMPSPVGHAIGTQWGVRLAMYLGTSVVLQDRWNPAQGAQLLSENGCAFALATTPFVRDLADHVAASPNDTYDFAKFRFFVTAGAPIPRTLYDHVLSTLGAELLAAYGQAECYTMTMVRPEDDVETKTSCDGWSLPGVELRVVDTTGQDVPVGAEGECWTRGPHTMLGYLNPPADRAVFTPGDWLPTGDLVCIDERGHLRVVGRLKEIINRGGIKISPREIEELLLTHPEIAEVAVVPFSDERLGERVCAFVVPRGNPPSLKNITAFLDQLGLARFKWPERLEIRDALPMTASGKVKKTELAKSLDKDM